MVDGWLRLNRCWLVAVGFAAAGCAGDDSEDSGSGGGTAASSGVGSDGDSHSSGVDADSTVGGSGSRDGDTGDGAGDSAGDDGAGDSGGDGATGGSDSGQVDTGDATGSSDGGQPTVCGSLTCTAGEVCINPCCGGPAPACFAPRDDGQCAPGSMPIDADLCGQRCGSETCCLPDPCVPDPPYCAPVESVDCADGLCVVDRCTGEMTDGGVECLCA